MNVDDKARTFVKIEPKTATETTVEPTTTNTTETAGASESKSDDDVNKPVTPSIPSEEGAVIPPMPG